MDIIANFFTGVACLLHGYFYVLETFLWTTPVGLKVFKMNSEKAQSSAVLAANQGVYNLLLALGLLLSFCIPDVSSAIAIRRYCLFYIFVVGCYGAYSLKSKKVFMIQALPALIAIVTSV